MRMKNKEQYTVKYCRGFVVFLPALLFLVLLLSSYHPGPAMAQSLAKSFGGFSQNSNEPINIQADSLEVVDDKKIAVFDGSVKVTQGRFEMVSKRLKVTYSGDLGGTKKSEQARGIRYIDATGKVIIKTPDEQSATSDWAKFDVAARIVTIGGNVVLSQGSNVMKGDKLVIDLNTGRSKFHSGVNGRFNSEQNRQNSAKKSRITGVFLPGKANGAMPFGGSPSGRTGSVKNSKNTTTSDSLPALPWKKNK